MGWKSFPYNLVLRNANNNGNIRTWILNYDTHVFWDGSNDAFNPIQINLTADDYNSAGNTFSHFKLTGSGGYTKDVPSWPRGNARLTTQSWSSGIVYNWNSSVTSTDRNVEFTRMHNANLLITPIYTSIFYLARFFIGIENVYNQSFKPGLTYTAPYIPPMTGYTVVWKRSGHTLEITSQSSYALPWTEDVILSATYTPITYNITYENRLGALNWNNPPSYNIETSTIVLTTPTRTGYVFTGWFTALTGGTQVTTIPTGSTGNRTLYARWIVNNTGTTYDITRSFTGSGLTISGNTNYVAAANSQTRTVTVTRLNGYNFGSIYISRGSGSGNDAPTMSYTTSGNTRTYTISIPAYSYGSILFYAYSTLITYSLSYVTNGGTTNHNNATTYNVESAVTLQQGSMTRTGYTFGGWYSDSALTNQVTSFGPGLVNNRTFYAKWIPINYSLTYALNGSTAYPITNSSHSNPSSYTIEDDITFAQGSLARAGWLFNNFNPSSLLNTTGNRTININWLPLDYNISLNANGGSGIAINVSIYDTSQNNGSSISRTLTKPTRPGYTFSSWSISRTGTSGGATPTISADTLTIPSGSYGDMTITANWTGTTNAITFAGATIAGQNWTTQGTQQTKEFTIPARTGYRINSVSITTQSSGSNSSVSYAGYTGTITIPGNAYSSMVVTITWIPNTYTVAFDSQGGNAITSKAATYDVILGALITPVRAGYNFDGWFTATSGGTQITSNSINLTSVHGFTVTVYAQWTARVLTINYAANGGTGTMTPSYGSYDNTVAIKANGFTRPGYTFSGWLNSDTSAAETYPDPNMSYSVNDLSSTIDDEGVTAATITLSAIWTINQYTITFNSNGGTTVSGITQDYLSSVSQPSNPTKAGFTFVGWYTEAALTNLQTWPFNMPLGGRTLYAKWSGVAYTIYIDENGGTAVDDLSYTSRETGTTNITLPTVVKSAIGKKYSFSRWEITTNSQGVTSSIAGTLNIPALAYGNITVKAIWTVAERKINVGNTILATNKIKTGITSVIKVIVTDADIVETVVFENEEREE